MPADPRPISGVPPRRGHRQRFWPFDPSWLLVWVFLACGRLWVRAETGPEIGWCFQPLRQAPVPAITTFAGAPVSDHPVDRFVHTALAARHGLPAPAADRRTLLRRVTFDLTGLPPTPQESAAFLADAAPNAYERVVDRLLASPRYGERWARLWMDAAHFAETHGHDQDRIRTNAWPYRDFLIQAFNQDMPYARFVQAQVAGDVMFPEDPSALVAMGFLAAGPWDESSLRDIREDTLDRQIGRYLDRDDVVTTVMQTFTSVTVQCARCHDHKFDPISQKDYYALQAVFAGTDKANRYYDQDPEVHQRRQRALRLRKSVAAGSRQVLQGTEGNLALQTWQERHQVPVIWTPLRPEVFVSANGANLVREEDGVIASTGPRPEKDTYTMTATVNLARLTAIRLQVLAGSPLPQHGPGRAENGNFHLSEIQAMAFVPGEAEPRALRLVAPTADFNQDDWTVRHALDGDEKTAWGIHPREGADHMAVFQLAEPLSVVEGTKLVVALKQLHGGGHLIGRLRLSVTDASGPVEIEAAEWAGLAGKPIAEWSEEQRLAVTRDQLGRQVERELASLPAPSLVYAGASDFPADGGHRPAAAPREVRILRRGEITKPLDVATPGTLAAVTQLPHEFSLENSMDEGQRRQALAQWLTHADNPLTWRSIVNRVWYHHFGRGLVATVNDFGKMGAAPSHPELMDWLARWFRDEAHGSLKQLHRLLVTSQTYQRAAVGGTLEADPENVYLAHMNRRRLDAEEIHDAMLLASGRLDFRMGGPSDQQFDLQLGIHVTPKVDYGKFDVDADAGRRRSVYRFLFRTLPDPLMEALDCPNGDQLAPVRGNAVTVQQALALWNSAFALRQAAHFSARLEQEQGALAARVAQACAWLWGRPPGPEEARELEEYAGRHGVANLCRLLLNSNEFVFVN